MEEREKCSIRIPVSIMDQLRDESAETGKSLTTCIVERLQKKKGKTVASDTASSWIAVDKDIKDSIMFHAVHSRKSASEYLRDLLEPKPPINFMIPFHDLDQDADRIDTLIRTINSTCRIILASGNAYAQEVDTMIRTLRAILDEYLEIHKILMDNREKLYQEAQSEIRKEIEKVRYRTRKIKSRGQHGSNQDQGLPQ